MINIRDWFINYIINGCDNVTSYNNPIIYNLYITIHYNTIQYNTILLYNILYLETMHELCISSIL